MGVQNLWSLLSPAAQKISLEALNDKKLAVDISVWLNQIVKGTPVEQEDDNRLYLKVLFHRVCTLLFHGVKPVFVFDGKTPELKKRTIENRKKGMEKDQIKLIKIARKLALNKLEKSSLENEEETIEPSPDDVRASLLKEYDSQIDESLESFLLEMKKKQDDKIEREIQAHEILCQLTDQVDEEFIKALPKDIQIEVYNQLKLQRYQMSPQSNFSSPEDISQNSLSNFLKRSQMKKKISNIVFDKEDGVISKGNLASNSSTSYYLIDKSQESVVTSMESPEFLKIDDDIQVIDKEDFEKSEIEIPSLNDDSDDDFEMIQDSNEKDDENRKMIVPIEIDSNEEEEFETIGGNEEEFDEIDIELGDNEIDKSEFIDLFQEMTGETKPSNGKETITIEEDNVKISPIPKIQIPHQQMITIPTQSNKIKEEIHQESNETEIQEIQDDTNNDETVTPINEKTEEIELPKQDIEEISDEENEDESGLSPTTLYEQENIFRTPTKDDQRRQFLERESNQLREEFNKIEKQSTRVSNDLIEETKELLQILGLPIINSPYEADSQCSFLNIVGAVDGVITEDSDVFLFGATNVYRHLFGKDKNPQLFSMESINRVLGLDRSKLIQMGMFLGSDYTIGVHNVGIVTAMEFTSQFDSENENLKDNILESLNSLSAWVKDFKTPEKGTFDSKYFKQKSRFILPEDFPNPLIIDGYVNPLIDDRCLDEIKFEERNMIQLYLFAEEKMSIDKDKLDQLLKPINEKSKKVQKNISNYLVKQKPNEEISSERIKKAIKNLKRKNSQIEKSKKKK
eukprot:gene2393-2857_t